MINQDMVTDLLQLIFSKKPSIKSAKNINFLINSEQLSPDYFRLYPLLYKRVDQSLFPKDTWHKIRSFYRYTVYRNNLLAYRASCIQKSLKKYLGCDILVLKGLALSLGEYNDIGIRPMEDIDLFCPKFSFSSKALFEFKDLSLINRDMKASTFIDSNGFEYDIHRKIHNFAIKRSVDKLCLKDAINLKYKKLNFRTLCSEHQLVHVIYHGIFSADLNYSKRWYFDALVVLQKNNLNPSKAIELVKELSFPGVIRKGIDSLLKLPDDIHFNRNFLKIIRKNICSYSKLTNFMVVPRPVLIEERFDTNYRPNSRGVWLKDAFIFHIVLPYLWRKQLSYLEYYQIRYELNLKKDIFNKLWKNFKKRLSFVFFGHYKI